MKLSVTIFDPNVKQRFGNYLFSALLLPLYYSRVWLLKELTFPKPSW